MAARHSNIVPMLNNKYGYNKKYRKIAKMSLELGEEWTNIVMASPNFDRDFFEKSKEEYADDCRSYIRAGLDTSQVSSGLLLSIFLPIIIRWIIAWISQKIIDNIFKEQWNKRLKSGSGDTPLRIMLFPPD